MWKAYGRQSNRFNERHCPEARRIRELQKLTYLKALTGKARDHLVSGLPGWYPQTLSAAIGPAQNSAPTPSLSLNLYYTKAVYPFLKPADRDFRRNPGLNKNL